MSNQLWRILETGGKKLQDLITTIFWWWLDLGFKAITPFVQLLLRVLESTGLPAFISSLRTRATTDFVIKNTIAKPLSHTIHTMVPSSISKEELTDQFMNGFHIASNVFGPTNVFRIVKYLYTYVPLSGSIETPKEDVVISDGFDIISAQEKKTQAVYEKNSIWDPNVQEDLMQLGFDIASEGYISFCTFFED